MNIKACVLALSICLLPLSSNAGVLYKWRSLNNETPRGITLELEFDANTVASGEFSMTVTPGAEEPLAKHGLLGLRYAFPGSSEPLYYSAAEDSFRYGLGELDIRVSFDKGGYLTGYIYANDAQHHIGMDSMGRKFTIFDANSDEGMPSAECGWQSDIPCAGATGHIRRIDIPEPASVALLGIGLLAAGIGRRKAGQASIKG